MKFFLILILLASSFGSIKPQSIALKNRLPKSEMAITFFTFIDTTKNQVQDSIPKLKQVTFGTILGEATFGPLLGALFSLPAAYLSLAIIQPQGEMGGLAAIPFMYLGYVLGSSVGTYLIAHTRNPDVSFWANLGFGLAGSGAAIGFFSLNKDRMFGSFEAYSFLGLPVLFEILYLNLIAPNEDCANLQNNSSVQSTIRINHHKDLYNSTLLYKFELFRINF